MSSTLMLLPSQDSGKTRLVSIPADLKEQEAYRHATGIIAAIEENNPNYDWADIEDALEEHGFRTIDFIMGPALD